LKATANTIGLLPTASGKYPKKEDAPAEWGSREEINALAQRLQTMMPGDLSRTEALALVQYSAALDANPFRGEIYAYEHRGKLVIVDGYKLLVRWARRQCNFFDRYERLKGDGLPKGTIGYRCHVLRDDARPMLQMLIEAGAQWDQAFAIVAQSAVGIVRPNELTNSKGQPISPPKGWTWEQVARKRALKNAINVAYGAPSPREIARETWMVGNVETAPQDWPDDVDVLPIERELTAAYNANQRHRNDEPGAPITANQAYADLFEEAEPYPRRGGEAEFDPALLRSFEELCSAAVEHLGYADSDTVTDSLYRITGGDSNGLTYVSVWQLLVDHAAAGEEIAEKEPPF